MSDKIIIYYDEMDYIRRRLHELADLVEEDIKHYLLKYVHELENGGWQGRGAKNFYEEMYTQVFPSLDALIDALDSGAQTTQRTIERFAEAETDSVIVMENNILNYR